MKIVQEMQVICHGKHRGIYYEVRCLEAYHLQCFAYIEGLHEMKLIYHQDDFNTQNGVLAYGMAAIQSYLGGLMPAFGRPNQELVERELELLK